jgi:competence protein ComEC
LLIDCGDEHSAERLVLPFLRSRGLDVIETLLLTHGDIRHVGGTERVRQEVPIHHLAASPVPFRSAAYREVHAGGTSLTLRRGGTLGPWTVLHPADTDRFAQADDNALVLHGTLRGTRFLLLSDLGKPGQGALLSRQTNLLADVVIAGLPAQGEPLAEALLDAVRPSLIVLVDSLFPATARASARLRERLAARGVPVLCTSETGGLRLEMRTGAWRVRDAEGRVLASSGPTAR